MADLSLIKKLRLSTNCGIGDCNKALNACDNDLEKAVDWLRKKGLSSAVKKSGRITSEGAVSVYPGNKRTTIVEVNSETDFVARNQTFQEFVSNIAKLASSFGTSVEDLKAAKFLDLNHSVEEELKIQIGVIGENINIRRISTLEVTNGVVASYVHNATAPNIGRIAVLVALESNAEISKLEELGKQIAMHIAAAKPESLSIESVSTEKLKREEEILKEQARASGKPESIIDKMIEGRIKKYYEEVVLLEQPFVMDDKLKIKDLLKNFKTETSTEVKISAFELFILGEGIEKKEDDFAEEVAKMTRS